MKSLLLSTCILLSILTVGIKAHAQITASQTGAAAADLLNGTDAIISDANKERLQHQADALNFFKTSLNFLKAGKLNEAYEASLNSISTFHSYATPYLIAAYVCLQRNDALNAHRFLLAFDKYSALVALNNDLVKEIPADFIRQLRSEVSAKFNALSEKSLHDSFEKEGWNQRSLEIGVMGSYSSFGDIYLQGSHNDDIDGDDIQVHPNFTFSEFIWFNKKNAFPTATFNNIGLDLRVGADYQDNATNNGIVPNKTEVYFSPGVFLGRLYISPGKIYNNFLTSYKSSNPDSWEPRNNISFSPEIRWYSSFFSQYAATRGKGNGELKNRDIPSGSYMYLFFKSDQDVISGSAIYPATGNNTTTMTTNTFYQSTQSYLLGFAFASKRLKITEAFGVETLNLTSNVITPKTTTSYYNVSTTPFRAEISIAYRIL